MDTKSYLEILNSNHFGACFMPRNLSGDNKKSLHGQPRAHQVMTKSCVLTKLTFLTCFNTFQHIFILSSGF